MWRTPSGVAGVNAAAAAANCPAPNPGTHAVGELLGPAGAHGLGAVRDARGGGAAREPESRRSLRYTSRVRRRKAVPARARLRHRAPRGDPGIRSTATQFGGDVQFSSQRLADVLVAAPIGQIDHPNAERLKDALAPVLDAAAQARGALVLDFSGVDYISSMGLRVLLMAAKDLRARNARIGVAALRPIVQEIFDIARFNHVVEVFPTVRAALAQFSGPALAAFEAGPA
jgi:anti-sigma B factor antagonist